MRTDERLAEIRRNILRILRDCRGYLLPEPRLFDSTQVAIVPPPTAAEFLAELAFLDANGFVSGINPELGGPRKWRITDRGMTEVS